LTLASFGYKMCFIRLLYPSSSKTFPCLRPVASLTAAKYIEAARVGRHVPHSHTFCSQTIVHHFHAHQDPSHHGPVGVSSIHPIPSITVPNAGSTRRSTKQQIGIFLFAPRGNHSQIHKRPEIQIDADKQKQKKKRQQSAVTSSSPEGLLDIRRYKMGIILLSSPRQTGHKSRSWVLFVRPVQGVVVRNGVSFNEEAQ
jgi:hypothetical protein